MCKCVIEVTYIFIFYNNYTPSAENGTPVYNSRDNDESNTNITTITSFRSKKSEAAIRIKIYNIFISDKYVLQLNLSIFLCHNEGYSNLIYLNRTKILTFIEIK